MSINLLRTHCDVCEEEVILTGVPYAYHRNEARMVIADAECKLCKTKYSAWIHAAGDDERWRTDQGFYDLSYRSTFNDEPGESDIKRGEFKEIKQLFIDNKLQGTKITTWRGESGTNVEWKDAAD